MPILYKRKATFYHVSALVAMLLSVASVKAGDKQGPAVLIKANLIADVTP
jgi:hypothetical protein